MSDKVAAQGVNELGLKSKRIVTLLNYVSDLKYVEEDIY